MARKKKTSERIEPGFISKKNVAKKPSTTKARSKGRSGTKRRQSQKAKPRSLMMRFVRGSVYWCFVIGIWGVLGLGGLFAYYGARMPNANSWVVPDRPPNVKITSLDGVLLANRGVTGGEALLLSDMSPYIPQAVIAIEDRRFYSHFGIDLLGLTRALVSNISAGRTVQGGSTITQQLAKNLFLTPERTLERKVQEVLLSVWLENKFSKDQILEMYLNRVYFGSGAYGVEAAARRYFQKPAYNVNLAEAAMLAGLLKAPSRLSPARHPARAKARQQIVLSVMSDVEFITDREALDAIAQKQTHAKRFWTGSENFVADRVMSELPKLIGDIDEDLIVDTTLDMDMQRLAEQALRQTLDENGKKFGVGEGAVVAIDGSGAIRVLVGGRDYATSQFDRASEAKRQPGSAFKPFVYVAALEQGREPSSIRNDAPVKIGKWTPQNYDKKYRGPVTLTEALSKSLNTISAQLVMEVGPKRVAKIAHRLGIESNLKTNASIALGTSEVTLLELTAAYAPFMNGGYKATSHIIRRVTTASGKVLYENDFENPPRVISPEIVSDMNLMLTDVVRNGTGRKAQIDHWQVAGKTGTSQAFRDALFVGYTANLTAGVWLGNDNGTSTKKVTGGGLPAQIWHDFMAHAHDGIPVASLPRLTIPVPESDRGIIATNNSQKKISPIANLIGELAPIDNGSPKIRFTGAIPIPTSRDLIVRPDRVIQQRQKTVSGVVPPTNIGETTLQSASKDRKGLIDVILGR